MSQMLELTVILLCLAYINSGCCSGPPNITSEVVAWPDAFLSVEGNLTFYVFEFGTEARHCKLHCGDKQLEVHVIRSKNYEDYTVSIMTSSTKGCPRSLAMVRLDCDSYSTKFKTYRAQGVIYAAGQAFEVPVCPSNGGMIDLTVPASEDFTTHFRTTMLYCKIKGFTHLRTSTMVVNDKHYYKSGTENCRSIYVSKKTLNCTKYETSQRLKELNENEAWCKISGASVVDSDLLEIKVPYKRGGLVCVNGRLRKKKHQQCRSVESNSVSFKIPSGLKSVEITCDNEKSFFFSKEEQTAYCPMPFVDSSFALRVCQEAYKPVLFWISLMWACLGIPVLYTLNKLYIYIRCRIYLWRMKRGVKCNFCCQTIMSELDATNHFNCEKFICPYCEFREASIRSLKLHAAHCVQREAVEAKTHELFGWEREYYSNYYSITNRRVRFRLKIFWGFIFIGVFLSTFAPSIAYSSLRATQNYPTPSSFPWNSRISFDNPPRNHPPVQHDNTEKEVFIPVKDTCASSSSLATATRTIKDDIQMLGDLVTEVNGEAVRNTMEMFANMDENIINKLNEINGNLINIGMCQGEFETLNLNMYLPPSLHKNEYSLVKIHKDSLSNMHEFGTTLRESFQEEIGGPANPNSNGGDSAHHRVRHQPGHASLGQDAILQFGGETQISVRGDGDKRSVSANGGTSINMENFNTNDPVDFANKLTRRTDTSRINNARSQPRHEHPIDTSPPKWSRRTLKSFDEVHADEMEVEQTKLNAEREKIEEMKDAEDFESRIKSNPITDFHIFKNRPTHIKGKSFKVSQIDFHSKHKPVEATRSKSFIDTHSAWYDFHQEVEVCKKSCLHEPGTCTCIEEQLPASGKMHLPWTTFDINDIHFVVNPNKYSSVTVAIEAESKSEITVKFNTEVKIDLYENSFVTMELTNEKSAIKPTVTLTIPRISQIYSTKFLYYTCEREMTTEVKGVCTGPCGDYCKGQVCLGSRIWKFENCRTWACNPTWCWAWNDGCCCCGSIARCPAEKAKASVWETRYLRTEYLLCLILNDRVQNCQLISGTEKIEFGQFQVGATKAIDPSDKLPSVIMVVHKPIKNNLEHVTNHDSKDEVYLDPPVCKGLTACNHGFIGDLQTTRFECIQKIGTHCVDSTAALNADPCTHKTHMTHSDSLMHMQCHTGEHHSCHHDNIVKSIEFSQHLEDTEKIEERFNLNKFKINFEKNELLIYPSTKESSGFIMLNLEGTDIAMPKKDNPPKIMNAQSLLCTGCFSCTLGFECNINLEIEADAATSVKFKVVEGSVDMSLSPITVQNGKNNVKVRGVAYENVKKAKVCVSFGSECLYDLKLNFELHQPEGNFIPVFENDLVSGGVDSGDCTGIGWFKCAANSFTGFFKMLFDKWRTILVIVIVLLVVGVTLAFLPQICLFGKVVKNTMFKTRSKTFSQGPKINDIYKDLSKKIDTAMKKRTKYKVDDEDDVSEETKLFIQKADLSDFV